MFFVYLKRTTRKGGHLVAKGGHLTKMKKQMKKHKLQPIGDELKSETKIATNRRVLEIRYIFCAR
jgi:hypothetical protein